MKTNKIPIHRNELNSNGIEIRPFDNSFPMDQPLHRDEYFMFILQESGHFELELDFKIIELNDRAICFIAPGQVHRYIQPPTGNGWFIFLDNAYLSEIYMDFLFNFLFFKQTIQVSLNNDFGRWARALHLTLKNDIIYLKDEITRGIVNAFIGLIINEFANQSSSAMTNHTSKHLQILKFKKLIRANYITLKKVKDYAALMHITPLYLNELIKGITGFTASYWIQMEIILEAKRRLFYLDKDVKQISFDLGFEDFAYFSRFFKRHAGMTPSEFRKQKP
jgi:AraC family transcriptional regulator, transcriptional activator of pobA